MRSLIRSFVSLAVVTLAVRSFVACGSVPDLRFVEADAGGGSSSGDTSSGGLPRPDGGDGGAGGGATDADAALVDVDGGCTQPRPTATARCCGLAWCVDCTENNCTQCAEKAASPGGCQDNVCCGKPTTVVCNKQCQ